MLACRSELCNFFSSKTFVETMIRLRKLLFEEGKVLNEGSTVTSVGVTEALLLHWVFHRLKVCNRSRNIYALV